MEYEIENSECQNVIERPLSLVHLLQVWPKCCQTLSRNSDMSWQSWFTEAKNIKKAIIHPWFYVSSASNPSFCNYGIQEYNHRSSYLKEGKNMQRQMQNK